MEPFGEREGDKERELGTANKMGIPLGCTVLENWK